MAFEKFINETRRVMSIFQDIDNLRVPEFAWEVRAYEIDPNWVSFRGGNPEFVAISIKKDGNVVFEYFEDYYTGDYPQFDPEELSGLEPGEGARMKQFWIAVMRKLAEYPEWDMLYRSFGL